MMRRREGEAEKIESLLRFVVEFVRIVYLRGMKRDEWVAPIPGRPCLTGL